MTKQRFEFGYEYDSNRCQGGQRGPPLTKGSDAFRIRTVSVGVRIIVIALNSTPQMGSPRLRLCSGTSRPDLHNKGEYESPTRA